MTGLLKIPTCLGLLLFCFPLLITAQTHRESDIAAIKAARQSSNESIARHDLAGISKYMLNDFVQVRGNASHMTGKDSVATSWKQQFDEDPEVSYLRTPVEVIISANDTLAWETGIWKATHSYSKGGKYSAMWRKLEGLWKIQAELFVSLY